MFEVMLIVCFIDGSCSRLEDQRGPYQQEAECSTRLEEMIGLVPILALIPWRIEEATCATDGIPT